MLKSIRDGKQKLGCEVNMRDNIHSFQIRRIAMCNTMAPADEFLVYPEPAGLEGCQIEGEKNEI